MSEGLQEITKHGTDVMAGAVTVGSVLTYLPYWAALFTIVWTGLRIYILIETKVKTGRWG